MVPISDFYGGNINLVNGVAHKILTSAKMLKSACGLWARLTSGNFELALKLNKEHGFCELHIIKHRLISYLTQL